MIIEFLFIKEKRFKNKFRVVERKFNGIVGSNVLIRNEGIWIFVDRFYVLNKRKWKYLIKLYLIYHLKYNIIWYN